MCHASSTTPARAVVCDVAGTQPDTTADVSMIVHMCCNLQHNPVPLLRVMPPKSCAMGCGRQASEACKWNLLPWCGTCCDCDGHSRRSSRGGQKAGHCSKRARIARSLEQHLQWFLNDVVAKVDEITPHAWVGAGCQTPSACRRFLINYVRSKLPDDHGELQLPRHEPFLENSPDQYLERVISVMAMQLAPTFDEQAAMDAATSQPEAVIEENVPRMAEAEIDQQMRCSPDPDSCTPLPAVETLGPTTTSATSSSSTAAPWARTTPAPETLAPGPQPTSPVPAPPSLETWTWLNAEVEDVGGDRDGTVEDVNGVIMPALL